MSPPNKWSYRINEQFSPFVLASWRKGKNIHVIVDVDAIGYTDFGMERAVPYAKCVINPVAYGVARCHCNDKFDYNFGRAVAICNALGIEIPNFEKE